MANFIFVMNILAWITVMISGEYNNVPANSAATIGFCWLSYRIFATRKDRTDATISLVTLFISVLLGGYLMYFCIQKEIHLAGLEYLYLVGVLGLLFASIFGTTDKKKYKNVIAVLSCVVTITLCFSLEWMDSSHEDIALIISSCANTFGYIVWARLSSLPSVDDKDDDDDEPPKKVEPKEEQQKRWWGN